MAPCRHTNRLHPPPTAVTYIAGAALICVVAVALLALSCAIRRRNHRRLAEIEEAASRSAARRAARAERAVARSLSKQLALPVVILQPDGTCLLAARETQAQAGSQGSLGSDAAQAGSGPGADAGHQSRDAEGEQSSMAVVTAEQRARPTDAGSSASSSAGSSAAQCDTV